MALAPERRTLLNAATAPRLCNCANVVMPACCSMTLDFGPRFGSSSNDSLTMRLQLGLDPKRTRERSRALAASTSRMRG